MSGNQQKADKLSQLFAGFSAELRSIVGDDYLCAAVVIDDEEFAIFANVSVPEAKNIFGVVEEMMGEPEGRKGEAKLSE